MTNNDPVQRIIVCYRWRAQLSAEGGRENVHHNYDGSESLITHSSAEHSSNSRNGFGHLLILRSFISFHLTILSLQHRRQKGLLLLLMLYLYIYILYVCMFLLKSSYPFNYYITILIAMQDTFVVSRFIISETEIEASR